MLHCLHDRGNTTVVIEHNLDVIKTADWLIDLGPEGGNKGGTIVATGTPEEIAKIKASHTGQFFAADAGLIEIALIDHNKKLRLSWLFLLLFDSSAVFAYPCLSLNLRRFHGHC